MVSITIGRSRDLDRPLSETYKRTGWIVPSCQPLISFLATTARSFVSNDHALDVIVQRPHFLLRVYFGLLYETRFSLHPSTHRFTTYSRPNSIVSPVGRRMDS